MTDQPWQFQLAIQWLPQQEGGRRSGPPPGPAYAATAVFVLGGDDEVQPGWPKTGEQFSIALKLLSSDDDQNIFALGRFLAPDLADNYLSEGAELLLMEGPRVVANAQVISVNVTERPTGG